jgi:RNA polymerase sigma factor (sigma-70 family)
VDRCRGRRPTDSLDDVEVEASDVPSNPEKSAIRSDEEQRLWDAVLKLPEKYQTALIMFHFDSKSIREISGSLGRPEGTVKSDLHVAREMLRRKLEGVLR